MSIDDFNSTEFEVLTKVKVNESTKNKTCALEFKYFKTILETNLIRIHVPIFSDPNANITANQTKKFLQEEPIDVREVIVVPRK